MEQARASSLSTRRSPANSKVHVVTVCTRPEGCTTALLYSGAILDTDIQLLGWGEQCGGAGWRIKKIVDFCKEVDHTDIVAVVDAFNAVVLQPREVILEKFLEFGGRIVCMGQQQPQPRKLRLAKTMTTGPAGGAALYTSRAALSALHAGGFIGYAKDILFLFADAPADLSHHVLLEELYRAQPDVLVTIDANCSLFHRYRSRKDLLALTYSEAHAQSTHSPPVFERLADTPASASLCSSPPFFRPSPLPRIAMDALTRETPCFLHIPRSSSADTVLLELGLPRRELRRGGCGSPAELLPPCCRALVRWYKDGVVPGDRPFLDRAVSWLFGLFFLSLGILLFLAVDEAVRLLFHSFPEKPTDTGTAGFFFWKEDEKLGQADVSRSTAAGVAAVVTAVTLAVQTLSQACHAHVIPFTFLLVGSAGGLAILALLSQVARQPGSALLGRKVAESFRPQRWQVTASSGGGQALDSLNPDSQCHLYHSATSPYDAHLQHLLDEQANLRGADGQHPPEQETPMVVAKACTPGTGRVRRHVSRGKGSTTSSERGPNDDISVPLAKSDSSAGTVENGALARNDSRARKAGPARKKANKEREAVVRRRSSRTKPPPGAG